MAYITITMLILLSFWILVSLRQGAVNVPGGRGNDWYVERDTAHFSRRDAPVQFWIAIGALAGLWLVCAVVTVMAIWMGLAW
jgi:hypothetical protein